jgi:hypothetical protein
MARRSFRRERGCRLGWPLATFAAAAWLGLAASALLAQVNVNNAGAGGPALASDDVPLNRIIPLSDQVKSDMDKSRLRLGPVRLLPSIAVSNAGYDSNVFATSEDPIGDWTATFTAGLKMLVPFGTKVYVVADAFPQYTWYNKLTQRDQFGGVYDASLYGFFNHLSAEITGSYAQTYAQYSSEVDSQVFQTGTNFIGRLELDLSTRWSLFGQGAVQKVEYEQKEGPPVQNIGVQLNNRTETGARGGIRYHLSSYWNVAGLVEKTWADFDLTPQIRNSESTAYLASVHFDRPRFYLNLVGGYREGTGDDAQAFPNYATGVGSFFASWFPIRWAEIQGYGHRKISYSIDILNPYFFENRIGGRLNVQIGNRILLSGYGEVGPNNYPRAQPLDGALVKRRDDSTQYGGGVSFLIWRELVLSGLATRSVYDSNIPGDSRSYTRYTATLSFSGMLQR